MSNDIYDVAVIGAGVVGSMIARELSMYDIKLCVIEADEDVAAGASRANSGIVHAGYDAKPGSLKAKMNVKGCGMMKRVTDELGVPYQNCGSLVVAFSKEEETVLGELFEQGKENGAETEIIYPEQIKKLEPTLSGKVTAALYAKTAGIVNPYELTIAAAENAAMNGAELILGGRVTNIRREEGRFVITAGERTASAKYIVNAAGIFADDISKMAGGESFTIRARKGEYIIFDPAMKARTNTVIFGAPSDKGKGILFAPTTSGNMLAGPTSDYTDDKNDKATSYSGLASAFEGASRYAVGIDRRYAIAEFTGLRAVPETHDFIIEASKSAPGLVNAAGIESPGLTSSPAIAEYVVSLLFSLGLPDRKKHGATRVREPIESFSHASEQRKIELIDKDPLYANVVCRCMQITEAEVRESIRRPCGARTVDGVKFRTGAGMGRCHGGFCLMRVMRILAEETGRDIGDITKSGGASYILHGKTKETII